MGGKTSFRITDRATTTEVSVKILVGILTLDPSASIIWIRFKGSMTIQPSSQPGKPSSPKIIVRGQRTHICLTACNSIFPLGRETLKREKTAIGKPQVRQMVEYRKISIKKELADAVEKLIEANREYGYRSIAAFLEDSARHRIEQLQNNTVRGQSFRNKK